MATHMSATELRNMQPEELRKEIAGKRMIVAKMHVEIEMRSEKDTARFLREKKELARLLTVMNEKNRQSNASAPLKPQKKAAKMPAHSKQAA